MIVKLPNGHYVNPDHVVCITPEKGDAYHGEQVSVVWLSNGNGLTLRAVASDIAALLDPDNCCPEGGPDLCGYYQYLTRRRADESGDLAHQPWHLANRAAEAHAALCNNGGFCYGCQGHERVLRA